MEDIINLKSRDGTKNYLKKMKKADGSESKTYVLKSEAISLRAGWVDERHKFIDPSGGPMIVEGSILPEANAEVKAIIFVPGYGHTVTFK
mgnify:CR=1 FL=1